LSFTNDLLSTAVIGATMRELVSGTHEERPHREAALTDIVYKRDDPCEIVTILALDHKLNRSCDHDVPIKRTTKG
jgi:hypothetical protein